MIAVPACWGFAQRAAIHTTATQAGFQRPHICSDSSLAVTYWNFGRQRDDISHAVRTVVAFSLGAGFCSVSFATVEKGVTEVVCTAGDSSVGGDEFDRALVAHFSAEFQIRHPETVLASDRYAQCRLRSACERLKRDLSMDQQANIHIEAFSGGHHFTSSITRLQFEALTADLRYKCRTVLERLVHDSQAGMGVNDRSRDRDRVQHLIILGGASQMPAVRTLLTGCFPQAAVVDDPDSNDVLGGAAMMAALYRGEGAPELSDSLTFFGMPLSVGLATADGSMATILPHNAIVPASRTAVFTTCRANQRSALIQVNLSGKTVISDLC